MKFSNSNEQDFFNKGRMQERKHILKLIEKKRKEWSKALGIGRSGLADNALYDLDDTIKKLKKII